MCRSSAWRLHATPVLDSVGGRNTAWGHSNAVALAWLLHRAPNILLIPGTSSVTHLHENLAAAELVSTDAALTELGAIDGEGLQRAP